MVTYFDCDNPGPTLGCDWPLDLACLKDDWETMPAATQEYAAGLAGATLRRFTGYRVGGCPITVRPCSQSCSQSYGYLYNGGSFNPHLNTQGQWVNSCAHDMCSCTVVGSVKLVGPVRAINSVKIDGVVVPSTDYWVNGTDLISLGDPWPAIQDLAKPDTETGTWSVTYLQSYPVDIMGAQAATYLAMEFAKACNGKKCTLPSNVVSVTRQGVSFERVTGLFPNNQTGITQVDAYVQLWNPKGLSRGPSVWSPASLHRPVVDTLTPYVGGGGGGSLDGGTP